MQMFDIPIPDEVGQVAKESHEFNLNQVHSITAHMRTKDGKGQAVIRGDGAKPVYAFYVTSKSVVVTRVTGQSTVQKSYVRLVVQSTPRGIEDTWSVMRDSNNPVLPTNDTDAKASEEGGG
jgi:hypothetical protein